MNNEQQDMTNCMSVLEFLCVGEATATPSSLSTRALNTTHLYRDLYQVSIN